MLGRVSMNNGKKIGMALFVLGLLILIIYGFYQGFQNIKEIDLVIGLGSGVLLIGLVTLFASIIIEQRQGTQKMKEEISKEDLEP